MTEQSYDDNAERLAAEHEEWEAAYSKRRVEAMNAAEMYFVLLLFAIAVGAFHYLAEWFFGLFPLP